MDKSVDRSEYHAGARKLLTNFLCVALTTDFVLLGLSLIAYIGKPFAVESQFVLTFLFFALGWFCRSRRAIWMLAATHVLALAAMLVFGGLFRFKDHERTLNALKAVGVVSLPNGCSVSWVSFRDREISEATCERSAKELAGELTIGRPSVWTVDRRSKAYVFLDSNGRPMFKVEPREEKSAITPISVTP